MVDGLEAQLNAYIREHRQRGIFVDTNVLLLLLVARYQPAFVGQGRLSKYMAKDATLLADFVGRFQQVLTTAHVLAETSNLAGQMFTGRVKEAFFARIHPLFCSSHAERLVHCGVEGEGIDLAIFVHLGLTDAGVVSVVKSNCLLLTDDLDLYLSALRQGAPAINFTHMREVAGLL